MILITGSDGYIGSSLIEFLNKKKFSVRGTNRRLKLKVDKDLDYVHVDLKKNKISKTIFKNVESIIHTVSLNHDDCIRNPQLAKKINVDGTINLLKNASKMGVKQFIYLSTIHVYGNNLCLNTSEEKKPNPNSIYAKTHYQAEREIFKFCNGKNINPIILRISNISGCPTNKNINCWGLVINDLCKQSILKKKILLKTSGNQIRDFISLSDFNNIIYKIIRLKNKSISGVFNISRNKSVKIRTVAQMIKKISYKKFKISINVETNKYDTENYKKYSINNRKIVSTLNIKKFKNLEYDIDKVLDFASNNFFFRK
tara:strand:+ start:1214 stop:2152 length:939 start_codon:yes stop_codon:yes gene_type:complete